VFLLCLILEVTAYLRFRTVPVSQKTPVAGKKANSSPRQQGFSSLTGKTYEALPGRLILFRFKVAVLPETEVYYNLEL